MTRMSKWFATNAACCLGAMLSAGFAVAQDPPPIPPDGVPSVLQGEPIVEQGGQLGATIDTGGAEPGILLPTDSTPIEGEIVNEYAPGSTPIVGPPVMAPAGRPDLFYNYYVAPGAMGGNAAGMYTSPGPVPQHVGHTFYTYQPFYPHEFLYPHYREYHNYHSMGQCGEPTSYNKTEVTAYRGNFRGTYVPALLGNRYRAWKYGS